MEHLLLQSTMCESFCEIAKQVHNKKECPMNDINDHNQKRKYFTLTRKTAFLPVENSNVNDKRNITLLYNAYLI